jgi:hypothetical protein
VADRPRIYVLLIAGKATRFDGNLLEAEAQIEKYRSQGKAAAYLFSADSEDEFERKWRAEKNRKRCDSL